MMPRPPTAVIKFIQGLGVNFGFLVFMLVFVAGIGASTGYTVYRLRAKAIDEHSKIVSMHARAVEDHLTQSLNIVSQTLGNMGYGMAGLPAAQTTQRFETALLTSPALRSISLLDADGRIVVSSNPLNLGVRVDASGYLPPHAENTELTRIGRPWAGRDFGDGRPADVRAASIGMDLGFIPVVRTTHVGRQTYTLAAAVNPDYFINHYGARMSPGEGFVEVIRYDGDGLLSTEEPFAHGGSRKDFLRRISDVEFGSLEEAFADGTRVLTSFRASRSYPLIVVAHVKLEYALTEWAAESRRLLLVALPTLLAVVVLTTLLFVHLRQIEEQHAEARQRQQDRLAATVFQTVDSGVMVTDGNDRIIAVNPAFTHISGYSEEDMVGRKWQTLCAPETEAEALGAMSDALASDGSWQGEIWHRHRGGERYIAWQSITQVNNERGAVTYKVAAFSDITDRKKAEEAQLRAVIEASPEAVLLVDEDGTIRYANHVCEQVFGYAPAELMGSNLDVLVPQPYRGQHQHHVDAFAREPAARPLGSGLQLSALRRNGHEFPVEISLSPITMSGRLVVIASISDITQRIRDEQALRDSEERWKFALEGAGEGVWDWNIATGEVLYSKRILDYWGSNTVVNRIEEWTARIHPDDRQFVLAQLQACVDGRLETCAVEHRVQRNDGHWHWAQVRGMVVSRDADDKPLRVIGTYADVTPRKTVENELKSAKEAAEALLERASMAEHRILDISEQTQERIGQELHDDLGQHLTGAAFLSEILFRKLQAANRAESEDAASITRLINEAVAKTRTLAQGLYPVELKEAGLRSMLEQLAHNVERTYDVACDVQADDAFDVDDPGVAINLFRIAQEALNNAIRHGKADSIVIRMRHTAAAAVMEIEDDGCGLGKGGADKGGLGMHTMRYRAALIGAALQIGAGASGGTRVVIALPLPEEAHATSVQRST
jgi:PAS domain S-box-containing protein